MKNLVPVTIWGIEFDALINETKTLNATVPTYPVEDGFAVSDTIINEPIQVSMTLYLSDTPVTWLYRHGNDRDRVNQICDEIEDKWLSKELTKIVTSDTIYTNMALSSLVIRKSKEYGYAREISITAQQVRVTNKETVTIPDYILKSGKSMASAGSASVSRTSVKSSGSLNTSVSSTKSAGRELTSLNTNTYLSPIQKSIYEKTYGVSNPYKPKEKESKKKSIAKNLLNGLSFFYGG